MSPVPRGEAWHHRGGRWVAREGRQRGQGPMCGTASDVRGWRCGQRADAGPLRGSGRGSPFARAAAAGPAPRGGPARVVCQGVVFHAGLAVEYNARALERLLQLAGGAQHHVVVGLESHDGGLGDARFLCCFSDRPLQPRPCGPALPRRHTRASPPFARGVYQYQLAGHLYQQLNILYQSGSLTNACGGAADGGAGKGGAQTRSSRADDGHTRSRKRRVRVWGMRVWRGSGAPCFRGQSLNLARRDVARATPRLPRWGAAMATSNAVTVIAATRPSRWWRGGLSGVTMPWRCPGVARPGVRRRRVVRPARFGYRPIGSVGRKAMVLQGLGGDCVRPRIGGWPPAEAASPEHFTIKYSSTNLQSSLDRQPCGGPLGGGYRLVRLADRHTLSMGGGVLAPAFGGIQKSWPSVCGERCVYQ